MKGGFRPRLGVAFALHSFAGNLQFITGLDLAVGLFMTRGLLFVLIQIRDLGFRVGFGSLFLQRIGDEFPIAME